MSAMYADTPPKLICLGRDLLDAPGLAAAAGAIAQEIRERPVWIAVPPSDWDLEATREILDDPKWLGLEGELPALSSFLARLGIELPVASGDPPNPRGSALWAYDWPRLGIDAGAAWLGTNAIVVWSAEAVAGFPCEDIRHRTLRLS